MTQVGLNYEKILEVKNLVGLSLLTTTNVHCTALGLIFKSVNLSNNYFFLLESIQKLNFKSYSKLPEGHSGGFLVYE